MSRCVAVAALLVALVAAPAHAAGTYVWWEAENAAETSFNGQGDFNAEHLSATESALLSGGDWLTHAGRVGQDAPRAVYAVAVSKPGLYRLWCRKWCFRWWPEGAFRWRVDDGEWRLAKVTSALRQITPIRDAVEACWVYLGDLRLGTGAHRFEVELDGEPGDDVKAGLDCFCLARGRFVPNGATKPDGAITRDVQLEPRLVTDQDAVTISVLGAEHPESFRCTIQSAAGRIVPRIRAERDGFAQLAVPVRDLGRGVFTVRVQQGLTEIATIKGAVLHDADGRPVEVSPELAVWLDLVEHPQPEYDIGSALVDYPAVWDALQHPEDPYRGLTGLIVRAAYSEHFETWIPYLVYVPKGVDTSQPFAAVVHLHGMGGGFQAFQGELSRGQNFSDSPIVHIHPAGTPRDWFEGAGLANVLEVLADAQRKYPIDPDRIYLWGASMGGAGARGIARRLPDTFAGVVVQVGTWFDSIDPLHWPPDDPALRMIALRTDPLTWLVNHGHCGTYFITGTEDWSNGPSIMAARLLGQMGFDAQTFIYEGGHGSTPDKFNYADVRAKLLTRTRVKPEDRQRIRFRTDTLRFATSGWVTVNGLVDWREVAEVDAALDAQQEDALDCTVRNVSSFSLRPPRPTRVVRVNGQTIRLSAASQDFTVELTGDAWAFSALPERDPAQKNPERSGPLVDADLRPLLLVYGTRNDRSSALAAWARLCTRPGEAGWNGRHDEPEPRHRVVSDAQVLADEHLRTSYNLICFGGPEDNTVAAAAPVDLPPAALSQGDPRAICTYLRPSPFSDTHYVVVHVPLGPEAVGQLVHERWPVDWITYRAGDEDTPPFAAGMFDKNWQRIP